LQLTHEILSMAKESGVDCIVTACPLCQMNLDLRQKDVEAKFGCRYNLPVFYFTQLLGLAMGCSKNDVALGSLVVDPQPVLSIRHIAV
jgi:heterodisulfide reductase subunit B2